MALITWNDNLSVNVAIIDSQHKKLVDMINELNDAMRQAKGSAVIGPIINGLVLYTQTHFQTEERYFDQYNYPDKERHKKEHAGFVAKVTEFKNGLDSGSLALSVPVMNFLGNWLWSHIKGSDKKYSAFFNEKGLK